MYKKWVYPAMFLFNVVATVAFKTILFPAFLLIFIPFGLSTIKWAKGYENVWVFLIVLIEAAPVNQLIIKTIVDELDLYGWFSSFLMFIVCMIFLFSIEEIVIGFLTRFLYPNQKRVEF